MTTSRTATVTLGSTFAAAAGADVRGHIERALGAVAAQLGIDDQWTVQVVPNDPGGDDDQLIALAVDGRPCRFPTALLCEAAAYAGGKAEVPVDANALGDEVRGWTDADRVAELVGYLCRAVVTIQPGVLARDGASWERELLELRVPIPREGSVAVESRAAVEQVLAEWTGAPIEILIEPVYLRSLTMEEPNAAMFPYLRDGLYGELGVPVPPLHFVPDPGLHANGFGFRINALLTPPRIGLTSGTMLINDTAENLSRLRVEARPTLNPSTRLPAAIVSSDDARSLESSGYTSWNSMQFLILALAAEIRAAAAALMTRDVAGNLLRALGPAYPMLGDLASAHAPPDRVAPVLRALLDDGIPVRDLRRIVELLLHFALDGSDHVPAGSDDTDCAALAEYVRTGLADTIAWGAARGTRTVVAYLLDPELEDELSAKRSGSDDAAFTERVTSAVEEEVSHLPPTALLPAVLTSPEVRRDVRELLRPEFPQMPVISYRELPPEYNVQPVARIYAP